MTIQVEGERVSCSVAAVEAALRWLAVRKDGKPLRFLRYAIEDAASESAAVLGCLVRPAESMTTAPAEVRALAVWGLILDEIGKIGSTNESRRRNALAAAFRLDGAVEWKSTLDDRFGQLRELPGVFGDPPPTTTTPMHKAWRRAVSDKLSPCLAENLELLARDGEAWRPFVEIARSSLSAPRASGSRTPSDGAQPVFLERLLVAVEMRRRTAHRRLTVRNVVAREDGVDGYRAWALTGWTDDLAPIPVKAIFGCHVETSPGAQPGDPLVVDLRFPKPLRKGERHEFISLACEDDPDEERYWINVDVDHHGIAPGKVDGEGKVTGGLSISITFDDCVPEACWWYAEQTDYERLVRPPAGDPHLLEIRRGVVEHTFLEPCHPREGYGIAFRWPQP
ncbi:hypothetical protein GCM10027598_16400 [Amycolatopsis oliviviridis]|uniref:Uncharacterized protein n=1 Tax=Amycolatopsis oliviviridis TaxID=1471590 RepID=A0ABQ3M5W4_9PSEU|nr:hypothetical protein [Amycolatopsis oliviviridis]GHH33966.1 hypothetical protein GCM10017790_73160 [Amycolatopsis oliviviridis]